MLTLALLQSSLLSPAVLAFFIGVIAVFAKSDLKLPKGLYETVSVYLLLSLGIKGGASLEQCSFLTIIVPLIVVFTLGITLPFITFFLARFFKFCRIDAAALSAHYGSVSVVTFMTALLFLDQMMIPYDKYTVAFVAIMEIPGLIIGLLLARNMKVSWMYEIKSIMLSKSIFLLLAGLFIGYVSGDVGFKKVSPFFVDPFQGVLVLFMLEMGLLAASKIEEQASISKRIIFLGILIPILNGILAIVICHLCNLSLGNIILIASISASASYIAAPAAIRLALPNANPAYYLTAAIAITFPFNLCFGIPLYYMIASWLHSGAFS